MDIESIRARLERIYVGVGATERWNVDQHIVQEIRLEGDGMFSQTVNFGSTPVPLLEQEVGAIIHGIASLKDPIKAKLRKAGANAKEYEDLIDASLPLGLIDDLDNMYKHLGARHDRSKKSPNVGQIGQGLRIDTGQDSSFTMSLNPDGSLTRSAEGQVSQRISVLADIQDGDGNPIMTLDKLVSDSLHDIEKFLEKHNVTD